MLERSLQNPEQDHLPNAQLKRKHLHHQKEDGRLRVQPQDQQRRKSKKHYTVDRKK